MTNPIIPKDLIPDPVILNPSTLLLHCCCAPCSGGIIRTLINAGILPTVLFYNPNIHPEEEYDLRKKTLITFLEKEDIPFIDSDYGHESWIKQTKGLENEPQRGRRCSECFGLRLEFSAKFAKENGFNVFTSSFGVSRWKDMDQVNQAGEEAAKKYGTIYWNYNWRKNGIQELMQETARQEQFYRQTYCGCEYSR